MMTTVWTWYKCQYSGGHWPRKGYGHVRHWKPPFHASPVVRKGPIWATHYSQVPKFGNFQFTRPQICKFSVHKTPFLEAMIISQAPHFRNPGRAHPYLKKVECAPRVSLVNISMVLICDMLFVLRTRKGYETYCESQKKRAPTNGVPSNICILDHLIAISFSYYLLERWVHLMRYFCSYVNFYARPILQLLVLLCVRSVTTHAKSTNMVLRKSLCSKLYL